jgi:hypothetical protein
MLLTGDGKILVMGRWIRFFIAIAIGAAAAMYYGWVVNPVQYPETSLETLRIDYKTDYVLMVAEAYRIEGDLDLAARRLAIISTDDPDQMIAIAIQEATNIPYPSSDLALMQALYDAFKAWSPVPERSAP